jgi:hypothetical protein
VAALFILHRANLWSDPFSDHLRRSPAYGPAQARLAF